MRKGHVALKHRHVSSVDGRTVEIDECLGAANRIVVADVECSDGSEQAFAGRLCAEVTKIPRYSAATIAAAAR